MDIDGSGEAELDEPGTEGEAWDWGEVVQMALWGSCACFH